VLNFSVESGSLTFASQYRKEFYLFSMKLFPFILACSLLIISCKSKKSAVTADAPATAASTTEIPKVEQKRMSNFLFLQKCMSGNFDSKEQSLQDKEYFDIRLRMVPIWKTTENVFYLYVEQSMSTAMDKPYRQRVYKVVKEDDTHFTSYIYTLPEPEKFVGKLEGDVIFSSIDQEIIVEKVGCEVKLKFDPATNTFIGSTGDNVCPSDRSGAKWASSQVTISEQQMISWDQGWDESGKQVWGATKGGYIFKKSN
jgi:CpeT protein